jgi:pyruvate dehydrogenase E2 component (dihydrolipoamide acetyltransferase)
MEEGIFVGWLKQDGDAIRVGENLFTLEGEKATEDIECLDGGILRIPPTAPKPGDKVAVGTVIGYLVRQGESLTWAESSSTASLSSLARSASEEASAAGLEDSAHPTPAAKSASPSVRRLARQLGVDVQAMPTAGRVTAADVKQVAAMGPDVPRASPRARRAAAELGVDWTKLRGGGRTGRIRERDVRAASTGASYKITRAQHVVPRTARRQAIASRLQGVVRSAVPVTLTTTADATNLVNLRDQFKTAGELVPSYTDFFAKLAAAALREHPLLNASWVDDQIVVNEEIHVGIAVDTEAGLLVPVVRDVPNIGLRQLAAIARDLTERARLGKLKAAEMEGGTFTVTNLGNYSIDAFTPIINPPQCAILGIGRIQRQPVVSGDAVAIREQVTLSLTFDHRIVDGAPAARFLQALVRLVENPGPALVA